MDTTSRRGPVYKRLMLGMRAETAATVKAHGIGDGANAGKSARHHQPASGEEGRRPMGMGPGKGREANPAPVYREKRQSSPGGIAGGFDYVVHTNHAVLTSTRKRTARVPFLVLVK